MPSDPGDGLDADFLHSVGASIRERRKARDLTVQALADEAGISRRLLTQIEHGQANPSLVTVTRLARALGADFTTLLQPHTEDVVDVVAPQRYTRVWTSERGSAAYLLVATAGTRNADLWHWELAPGDSYRGQADPAGSQELFHVLRGTLTIETDGASYAVPAGSSARLRSDRAYGYRNDGAEPAVFMRTVALAR